MNLGKSGSVLGCAIASLALGSTAAAQRGDGGAAVSEQTFAANYVVVSEHIHTAGQPNAEVLADLGDRGFELVINLAPPTSPDAVANEGQLVAAAGAAYVNIPVRWQEPTAADFDLFSAVMQGAEDKQVLVHCQLNMRASAFTFLYRVVHGGVAPEVAFQGLSRVWVPTDQWAEFVNGTLEQHGIDYRLPAPAAEPAPAQRGSNGD